MVLNTTHKTIAQKSAELGLEIADGEGTKAEKLGTAIDAVSEANLPRVAENYLKWFSVRGQERNNLQDLVWARGNYPEIPTRFRRELARALKAPLYRSASEFMKLLDALWVLDTNPYVTFLAKPDDSSLRARIERHFFNNDDWDAEDLFGELGAFASNDRRFALFIEGLASAEVLQDVVAQETFVTTANASLKECAIELIQTDVAGGYPVFRLRSFSLGPAQSPKNLIFASSDKPDLRLRSALDNNVEVVTGADKVLIYDRPIGDAGLTWSDLQDWWASAQKVARPEDAKRSLYQRMFQSFPTNSPPQRNFALSYYKRFGRDIPRLPALLPEVWLHWDPKTVKERGADALFRFRMDFLMLLPNRVRVVVEIDGKHHYADEDRASPSKYAAMVAADRELRLAGYEVFRFGGAELRTEEAAGPIVGDFFESLFERYRITYTTNAST